MSQHRRAISRFESESEQLSETIIRAIADAEGVDSTSLDTPLFDVVDPDALDRLFQSPASGPRSAGRVVFHYCGYEVDVHADGRLTLTERRDVDRRAKNGE